MFLPRSRAGASARPAAAGAVRPRRDRSIAVIVFMMALVFVPVLGMHVAAAAFGAENPGIAVTALADRVATLLSFNLRSPG
ncbi:hypothetical protein [Methylobacterium planeticum]|uniref:Uncharacterized protein n=1 Tax=Methylobacterium planeticum TaxID=2615211 RepID=A0A6N6MMA5_9HYPH|nr:hypothetical protein [Methylobacterium planeticum]KAB1072452.1 hypothetical protein F6X51_15790 [Methylobacterium planeticum]